MSASQSLRLETLQAEANYAGAKRKIQELDRKYRAQEQAELADFHKTSKAIKSQEGQIVVVTAQLPPSLRGSIEAVFRRK